MFTRREGGTPVAPFLVVALAHHLNGQHMHKSYLEGEVYNYIDNNKLQSYQSV